VKGWAPTALPAGRGNGDVPQVNKLRRTSGRKSGTDLRPEVLVPWTSDFPHISTRSRRRSLRCAPRKETYPSFVARLASDADPAPIYAGNHWSRALGVALNIRPSSLRRFFVGSDRGESEAARRGATANTNQTKRLALSRPAAAGCRDPTARCAKRRPIFRRCCATGSRPCARMSRASARSRRSTGRRARVRPPALRRG